MNAVALGFFVLLILLALWGLRWHLAVLSRIQVRKPMVKAQELSGQRRQRLLEVADVNTLRYHYRVVEVVAAVVVNALGILVVLLVPSTPARTDLTASQALLTSVYAFSLLPVITALIGGSGLLSFVDCRLWDGKPARLRDLPWLRPWKFF